MNTSLKMVKAARAKAMMSAPLRNGLKEWFKKKGACPDPEVKDFVEWVERRLDYLAGHMGKCRITVDSLVTALKVQAVGDVNALALADKAKSEGWKTDTNCYLEEGVVWASVWLSGKEPKETEKRADEIAAEFRKLGYTTDIWVDEEDEGDITVNAAIDFKLYLKNEKKGGR